MKYTGIWPSDLTMTIFTLILARTKFTLPDIINLPYFQNNYAMWYWPVNYQAQRALEYAQVIKYGNCKAKTGWLDQEITALV